MPARDGNKRHSLGIVTNFLNEGGRFLHNLVETILRPLQVALETFG